MSNFTEFLTIVSGYLNTVLNYALFIILVVIIGAIIITELIKTFNPEIDTTEQAIKHIATKLKEEYKEEEENEEEYNTIFDEYNTWLVFLLYPMIGVFFILAVILPLFPTYTAGLLDQVIKYYISVLPYFAMFVALSMGGLMFSRLLLWGARKTFDLATSTMKIIKEEKEDE